MTKNSDFKKRVRARMQKTGESYMAARAQLSTAPAPTPDEYADIAGISDRSVTEKTGKGWVSWVEELDALGAASLDHKRIARTISERWPEVGGWWAQSITVSYERIRGLRSKGQLSSGDFAASKSKTFAVPIATLFAAFGPTREDWIGTPTTLRTSKANRSIRLTWPDGSVVAAWFTDKGPKSTVSIQHSKLPNKEARDAQKAAWSDRLTQLAKQIGAHRDA